MTLGDFNLLDPASFVAGHPHDAYDCLRREQPMLLHPGSDKQPPFWLLTRYEDMRVVSLDAVNFTSSRGFRISTDNRLAMAPEIGQALARFMLAMDQPEHNAYRALVSPLFMPSGIKAVETRVRASVTELMDRLEGADSAEFVAEIGAIVPIKTICAIMGIPAEDEGRIFDFTNSVFGTDDPDYAPSMEEANRRYLNIFDYGWQLLEARRRDPQDDLISRIANGRIDGAPLGEIEQKSFFSNMLAAGNETTRSSLSGAIWALSVFRDERRRLIADPSLIPGAVNEILRWFSPVLQMARTATQDVEIGGTLVCAGERVAMLYGAGNHDPAMFDDPHRLDVTRANASRHLTFGYGFHHCLGSRLAILQLRLILEAFLARYPEYELLDSPRYIASNFVGAMKALPISLNG
ncbi:cytochrome P450 [Sphingobium lactosutens]|uniref:cytochrome P450 n=1 Tax=Sphingobium lactosutens TaxID=522773 RepID=UPI0015BFB0E7|nr:cytochrome P450 [Sphingobium lactosutens]